MKQILHFFGGEAGGATVEFAAIMPIFLIITFMVVEVALAVFEWQTQGIAAQVGARLAVVSDPAAAIPLTNAPANPTSDYYGEFCTDSNGGNHCASFSGQCALATCAPTVFSGMKSVFALLNQSNATVTINYAYVGMGFVGGPTVPAVTVTVSNVNYATGFSDLLGAFFGQALTTIPSTSTTLTGEDLCTANNC
jgi:Flp pilus assembly protein TadG